MTAQAADTVAWAGEVWTLLAAPKLFDPADHGITPIAYTTASWRGYICRFRVAAERLLLAEAEIGLAAADVEAAEARTGPVVAGRAPASRETFGWRYDLDLPIELDGSLLLGADFIQGLYVHMGFHPAWKFERVVELRFEGGRLVATDDRSEAYAAIRAQETAAR